MSDLLYQRIARTIEEQIEKEVWKVGDKLPSIRMICREHGVSMSTAQFAYQELERKSLIDSKPQSGFFVTNQPKKRLGIPSSTSPTNKEEAMQPKPIFEKVRSNVGEKNLVLFSHGVPATSLLPVAKLNKQLIGATRKIQGSGTVFETVEGNDMLRRQIAKWSFSWKGKLASRDVITTAGCINALSLCMMAVTKPGDTIAVESPCFYATLQLAKSLGLNVLELPTDPQTGIDLDVLKKIASRKKLALCVLVSNFSNPLGSLMPDEHKKIAVELLEHYNIPLIEDDLYGDIYFGSKRPLCCKSFDESGNVMLCSSFSKTLAPGYRVGWTAPGKFLPQVLRLKFVHSLANTSITHEVIGRFLESGGYEAHLRRLRQALHTNYLQYVRCVGEYFPEGTKVARPQGGLSLWVELPKNTSALALYEAAIKQKISIAPGPMFSLQNQYNNCVRLSYGMPWTERLEQGLKTVGRLAKG